MIGSFIPVVGTTIGAAVGATIGFGKDIVDGDVSKAAKYISKKGEELYNDAANFFQKKWF
jgi:uncharacterized membrane protein